VSINNSPEIFCYVKAQKWHYYIYATIPHVEKKEYHRPTQTSNGIQILFRSMRAARIKLLAA